MAFELNGVTVKWHGHATFSFHWDDRILYTDPFVLPKNPPKADVILVTHSHYDHCDEGKIRTLLKDDTKIVCSRDCADTLPFKNVLPLSPGKTIIVSGVKITAIPAYNTNKFRAPGQPFHPKENGWNGYVFEINGIRFYQAGDTDFIPEMRDLRGNVDVALLPVGGTYTMNVQEAAEAAKVIKPAYVIPMHYNYLPGLEVSENKIQAAFEGIDAELVIMEVE